MTTLDTTPTEKTLPRGVTALHRANGVVKYRVQVNRRGYKLNKVCETLEEATELANATKSITGKKQIHLLEAQKKIEDKLITDFFLNENFSVYVDSYFTDYQENRFKDYDPETAKGKFKIRNLNAIRSFCNVIKETEIKPDTAKEDAYGLNPSIFVNITKPKPLGQFKPIEITDNILNKFIRQKLKEGMKPSSIDRYLQIIRNVFKKIPILDTRLKDIKVPQHDKDLLLANGRKNKKRSFRFTDDERIKFVTAFENYSNPQLAQIIKLCLMTGCRRNEIVLLEWSQVKGNHLVLDDIKTDDRNVFLTPAAKELLSTIPRRKNDPRVFTYTVAGFQQCYKTVVTNAGLQHIKMNDLRKESISSFIEEIGASNSVLVAQILGIKNLATFEKNHVAPNRDISKPETQEDVAKHIGHKKLQTTIRSYFSLLKN